MAIQLYARKKAGGLKAAQAAGRIVTRATLMIAELYAKEQAAKTGPNGQLRDRKHETPGKVAIAHAAEIDHAALSRLRPVVEATDRQVQRAMAAIEERGSRSPWRPFWQ